jgi:four helix bundle protein
VGGEFRGARDFLGVPTTFKELVAYRRAVALADEVHDHVVNWPKADLWSSGIQLLRAVDSVGANIAEATGRWHTPDRRRFLYIARGSLMETEHWLLCAERRGLLANGWSDRITDVRRPLNGLIKKTPPN